jgi:hypothetical protein
MAMVVPHREINANPVLKLPPRKNPQRHPTTFFVTVMAESAVPND